MTWDELHMLRCLFGYASACMGISWPLRMPQSMTWFDMMLTTAACLIARHVACDTTLATSLTLLEQAGRLRLAFPALSAVAPLPAERSMLLTFLNVGRQLKFSVRVPLGALPRHVNAVPQASLSNGCLPLLSHRQ
jgi:hypothetical protein